jgi:hypothetical protein
MDKKILNKDIDIQLKDGLVIKNIHRGKSSGNKFVYAELYLNDTLLISSTLDYIVYYISYNPSEVIK